jgi:hypothetical protein
MDNLVIKMSDGFNAIINIKGVAPRGASAWEQKFGYKADAYHIHRTGEKNDLVCLDKNAAWVHASAANKAGKLQYFCMEIGELYFEYNFAKGCWELDAVINPDNKTYNVCYTVDGVPGIAQRATFAAAKQKADEEYGTVYTVSGQFVYAKYEPPYVEWDY